MGQANEKTEKATPRKLSKEREKGNISKSQDLSSAIMISIGMALLFAFSGPILKEIHSIMYWCFTNLNPKEISTDDIMSIFLPYISTCSKILMPFFVVLCIVGILVMRFQVGHVFAVEKIKPKMENISPSKILQNAKRTLNPVEPRNLVEFVKSLLKLLIVFFCGFSAVNGRLDELVGLLGQSSETAFGVIGSILTQMVTNICLAMLIIGFLDKKYQDYEFDKSMKMTKQEIKDEYKQTEGDPEVKAKIRAMQMKMARQKMFSQIGEANVVVTNPTHYAVALKYDKLTAPAPVVVAKGIDFVAFKIREIAIENKVPIVENPPLARQLYKLVPLDGIIPSELFIAVAEVLAHVYKANHENNGGK